MLGYSVPWRDFQLRNTMSTVKLKNMKFEVSQLWGEKRPTKHSEDRIPTMLGPVSVSQTSILLNSALIH